MNFMFILIRFLLISQENQADELMFKWIILMSCFDVLWISILTCMTSCLQNQSASVSSRMRQRPVSGSLASREKRRETPLQRCQLLTAILPVPNTVTSVPVAPVIMYLVWSVRVVLFGVVWTSARSLNHDIDECFVSKLREGSAPCVDSPCLPSLFMEIFSQLRIQADLFWLNA